MSLSKDSNEKTKSMTMTVNLETMTQSMNLMPLIFSVSQKTLEKALSFASNIIDKKQLMPILSHIKIEINNGRATLTATNMDLVIKESFVVNTQSSGTTCVPAELFYDIVRKLDKNDTITCSLEGAVLQIKTRRSDFRIPVLESELFPDISEMPFESVFTYPTGTLLALLNSVSFCMSTSEVRYALMGLYCHQNEHQGITFVGTDLHRLGIASSNQPMSTSFSPCIIGSTTVSEWQRILDGSDEEARLYVSKARIQLEVMNASISVTMGARLLDGSYPNYKKVTVKEHPFHAVVKTDELKVALERIALVLSDEETQVNMSFSAKQLLLDARSRLFGTANETLDIEYTGDDLSLAINGKYILDVVRHMKEDSLQIFLKGRFDVVILETQDAQYFIMPLIV